MKKKKAPNRPTFVNTRKALRKEKRKQKKVHRLEYNLKKRNNSVEPHFAPGRFVKRAADVPESEPEAKKKKIQNQPTVQDILQRQQQKEKNEADRLISQMEEQRRKILVEANEDEDKMIKKLEKQLGLNKTKNKNNFFADDGLDYLLEICDRTTTEQIVAAEKHLAGVEGDSDFEEDLAVVTGKELDNKKDKTMKKKKDDKSTKTDDDEDDFLDDDISDASGEGFSEGDEDMSDIEEDSNLSDNASIEISRSNKVKDDIESNLNNFDNSDGDDNGNETYSEEELSSEEEIANKKTTSKVNNKKATKSRDKIVSEKNLKNVFSDDEISQLSEDDTQSDIEEKLTKKKDMKKAKSKNTKKKERIVSESDLNKVFSDDEVSHLSSDDEDEQIEEKKPEKPDVWEDIYGRKRDKEGNVIKEEKGIYIPPHLRNKDSSTDKQLEQLKRHIKSVLNKLAGTNLHWACTSIENLYSNNSRNSVNTALTQLWLDATVGPSATPDRMVAEHAALVSVLHANVGSEIGAHFLQELSKQFDEMMQSPQPVEDKRIDNLVSCLAHLYSFKIYQASLLYDILARLVEELTEKNIDCVLTALRIVGGVLRKEEPLALKTFIHDTQAKIAKLNENSTHGTRIKFLVEVLLAVKNNNLTKIPNYEPTYVEQLKKTCRGVVRKGNYVTPLNIRLEDLLKAEERGKWWVVGSAWEGNRPLLDKPESKAPSVDQKLLELARQQRMNTDVRRSIFCVIMSAEDYMDAFEKLQHLGLKGQQEREVVHVLVACCLQENTYNPYYAVLGQKLCDYDRKYQLSIQYSVWDKIKDMESLSKQAMTNLAQFLTHLIMEKGLPLSALKIIQFSDLNKRTVRFMRQILLAIIMNADFQASLEVFHRISKPPKLHMFRESLRLFIQHFLIKNTGKKTKVLSEDEMATLKERAVEVDKILTQHETKLRF